MRFRITQFTLVHPIFIWGAKGNKMNFKKLMARISAGTALAALVLSAGLVFSSTANAQAPMTVFGEAAASDTVGILVDGKACKNASIKADSGSSTGNIFLGYIDLGECGAAAGSSVGFSLNGSTTSATLTWRAGGAPSDAKGITLTSTGGSAPTVPSTGNAGYLVSQGSGSAWLALALGLMAVGLVGSTRMVSNRSK